MQLYTKPMVAALRRVVPKTYGACVCGLGRASGQSVAGASRPAMASFRGGGSEVLVATNVAARGIDIARVGLVVSFELPDSPRWLTHRLGRTARMGDTGRALAFVTPEDEAAWQKLRRQDNLTVPEIDAASFIDDGLWRYKDQRTAAADLAVSRRNHPRLWQRRDQHRLQQV